jgi:hypothetical protein
VKDMLYITGVDTVPVRHLLGEATPGDPVLDLRGVRGRRGSRHDNEA